MQKADEGATFFDKKQYLCSDKIRNEDEIHDTADN
jgi:hypothetical protein